MEELEVRKAFSLLEPGPVALLTTYNHKRYNIMTFSWHMVMDFTPRFALLTGPWNYSYHALIATEECVISIPTIDLMEKAIGIGTTSGKNTDKFEKFGLTAIKAEEVKAPLIKECYANIECRISDHIEKHDIFVLEAVYAWIDKYRKETKTFHYKGDGTFIVDGKIVNHRKEMKSLLLPYM